MSTEYTLTDLRDALEDAAANTEGRPNAGALRFRFAIPYGDYAASTFADVDPFGRIIGVTVALDGSTYVDIVPEHINDRQGVLI